MAYDGISFAPGKNTKSIPWHEQFNRLFTVDSAASRDLAFRHLNRRVDWHRHSDEDFVSMHRCLAGAAPRFTSKERRVICKSMFYRATSDRTLNVACDDIGYEGKNWDLNFEVQPNQFEIIRYQMMRSLSWYLREGEYTPEPFHRKKIPKRSGGTRVLHIPTEDDRVVQRGIYLTVGPYLDACFHDFHLAGGLKLAGFMRWRATVWAATSQDRYWVVIADIKDAFPSTPRLRVRELVRKYLPQTEDICDLIDLTLSPHKKGLPQGSPLSPMLLNLYLHHNPDRKWHQLGLDIPLLRYADDIMLLCKSESEARQGYRELVKQLANAGLQLKHGIESCVCDTRTQQRCGMVWVFA